MPEYLIVGGEEESAVHALAVAADILAHVSGAQVDIAVPVSSAAVAGLSQNVRRVVGYELAPTSLPEGTLGAVKDAAGGGWKSMLSAASGKVKEAAASAAENLGQYKALREELRIARYDIVFDLHAGAGSIIVARCADAPRVVGFAAENIPNAPPGIRLLYHNTYPVPPNMPRGEQCRTLVARALGYDFASQPEWNFKPLAPPPSAPAPPYILLGDKVPEPFVKLLAETGKPLVESSQYSAAPEELFAVAAAASCVAGGGLVAALGAAAGVPTMFIGGKQELPTGAVLTESPAALKDALRGVFPSGDSLEMPPDSSAAAPESSETAAPEDSSDSSPSAPEAAMPAAPETPKEPDSPQAAKNTAAAPPAKTETAQKPSGGSGLRIAKD